MFKNLERKMSGAAAAQEKLQLALHKQLLEQMSSSISSTLSKVTQSQTHEVATPSQTKSINSKAGSGEKAQ